MSTNQIPFRPAIAGFFASRFYRTVRNAIQSGILEHEPAFEKLVQAEIEWASSKKENKVQTAIYEAVWRLLHDLQRVGWTFSWTKNCLYLTKPSSSKKVKGQFAIAAQKEQVKQAMSYARTDKLILHREFIEKMLYPSGNGAAKLPVTSLIADGKTLGNQLSKARRSRSEGKTKKIVEESVKPYLQLISENDRCEFTGHKLSDIWRFFRFTWANPPETTPGRTLLFLVRDAAQENHPIMAIFSLENAALRIKCRDEKLGWDPSWFRRRLENSASVKEKQAHIQFLLNSIDRGLSEIKNSDWKMPFVWRRRYHLLIFQ